MLGEQAGRPARVARFERAKDLAVLLVSFFPRAHLLHVGQFVSRQAGAQLGDEAGQVAVSARRGQRPVPRGVKLPAAYRVGAALEFTESGTQGAQDGFYGWPGILHGQGFEGGQDGIQLGSLGAAEGTQHEPAGERRFQDPFCFKPQQGLPDRRTGNCHRPAEGRLGQYRAGPVLARDDEGHDPCVHRCAQRLGPGNRVSGRCWRAHGR